MSHEHGPDPLDENAPHGESARPDGPSHADLIDPWTDPRGTYVLEPDDLRSLLARIVVSPGATTRTTHTPFTGGPLAAVIGHGNLAGTQFHPEKSQEAGLRLIGNFLRWRP